MTPEPRLARTEDAPALAALKRLCFCETFLEDFAIPYPAADIEDFFAESYSAAQVAAEIADPTHASWVSEDADGGLLGYAHAGPCKLPHPQVHARSGELYQLYVRRSAQGLGVGRALLTVSLDWIATFYPGPQWIGVWSGNLRAQAVYTAKGFAPVGRYQFAVGSHRDDELIFRRN
jgi:GNAT superfamily N-acetyltransferase